MKIAKSYEIFDAKISFVSLVDKPANKRTFLVTKADDGTALFESRGRIIRADSDTHYVTGVVYEPLVEDTQGNHMTADEIRKAAYWFAKNGCLQNDLQHSFVGEEGLSVVESYIAPSDVEFGEEKVTKGTWLMTVEVTDDEIWEAIEKGKITGFSIGGTGKIGEEDVDLDEIEKTEKPEKPEKKGIFRKWLEGAISKGKVKDMYDAEVRCTNLDNAFRTLRRILVLKERWNDELGRYDYVFESDKDTIHEALEDFSAIISDLLITPDGIAKALDGVHSVVKAGKKMSAKNKTKLDDIIAELNTFRENFEDEGDDGTGVAKKDEGKNRVDEPKIKKGEDTMINEELNEIVRQQVAKAMAEAVKGTEVPAEEVPKTETTAQESSASAVNDAEATAIAAEVEKAVAAAIEKANEENKATIVEAVAAAVAPIYKAVGLPSNLNDEQEIEKSEDAGVFTGFFG